MTLAITPDPQSARATFRERTCAIARAPDDAALHLARLHAALQLPGAEPVQGANLGGRSRTWLNLCGWGDNAGNHQ